MLRQLQRFFAHQPRRQHGKFATSNPRDQVQGFRVPSALSRKLFSDCLQELICTLTAQTLVKARQILHPQQQQITGAGLLGVAHPRVQLHLEITSVGQTGQVVLIGLNPQFFTALGLFLKQRLELLDHLIHGLHHAPQFRRARQLRQAEKLTTGNGVGLLNHVIERFQLPTQQQRAQYRADHTADQQPDETAQGALPQLGQGKHRVADHLDPCRLLPATADDRIAASGLQADQFDEPVRHAGIGRDAAALHQCLVVGQIDHADARVVTAVEDRADQQLGHRRVVDIRRQGQRQRRRRVLGVGAQLVDVLGTRALEADHEAAGEGDDQEQTDSDQQLFEQ
ncbi:hypothetical protein D3C71_937490 [compost metagenome]